MKYLNAFAILVWLAPASVSAAHEHGHGRAHRHTRVEASDDFFSLEPVARFASPGLFELEPIEPFDDGEPDSDPISQPAPVGAPVFSEPGRPFADFAEGLGTGVVASFASPGTRNLIAAGGALSLVAFAVEPRGVLPDAKPAGEKGTIYQIGRVMGGPVGTLGTAGALYALGSFTHDEKLRSVGHQSLEAVLLTELTVLGMKYAVGRDRPDGSNSRSFPSGHSAGTFALATVLQRNYGLKVGIPAYAAAGFVAFSRVDGDVHHVSDVVFGAALGAALGWTITRFHSQHFALLPMLGSDLRGVRFSLSW